MEKENANLDSWDKYTGGLFLKAADVKSEENAYVVVAVREVKEDDDTDRLRLSLERNESKNDFDVNKTNAGKLKELGIENPKALIGKKIYFRKVLVRNPKTNQEVDGLRISKVE